MSERESTFIVNAFYEATPRGVDALLAGSLRSVSLESYSDIVTVLSTACGQEFHLDKYEHELSVIIRRFPDQRVFIVYYDPQHRDNLLFLLDASSGRLSRIEDPQLLLKCRRLEYHSVVRRANTLPYHESSSLAFVAPSQRLQTQFFRTANLLYKGDAIDRLAFWLLPSVGKSGLLLVDTAGIAAIVYRAQMMAGTSIPTFFFESHPASDPLAARTVINQTIGWAPRDRPITLIVSVGSSGAFETLVRKELSAHGWVDANVNVVHLFALQGSVTSGTAFANLPTAAVSSADSDIVRRRRVAIDPIVYYPRLRSERRVQLLFGHFGIGPKPVCENISEVIDRLSQIDNALLCHYWVGSGKAADRGKHFAYFVDMRRVVGREWFVEMCRDRCSDWRRQLRGSESRTWVIPGAAEGSAEFANIVSEVLNVRTATSPEEVASFGVASPIVIIADAAVASGNSVKARFRALRNHVEAEYLGLIVGLARCPPEDLRELKAYVEGGSGSAGHLFLSMMSMNLPTDSTCAWCDEEAILGEVEATYPDDLRPTWLTDRLLKLRRGGVGADLFLPQGGAALQVAAQSQVVKPGASALAALFRFAAGLEELRFDCREVKRLEPGYHLSQVLDLRCLRRYNEHLLQACILRGLRAGDFGFSQNDTMSSFLMDELRESGCPSFYAAELWLACQRGVVRSDSALDSLIAEKCHWIGPYANPSSWKFVDAAE